MGIVYVDDDGDDRDLFRQAIEEIDPSISLTDFSNGNDMLEFLKISSTVPSFIFIDINMPLMNGHECAAWIKNDPKFNQSKIVMYSTVFTAADKEKFIKANEEHIVKPDKFDTLISVLKNVTRI